MGRYPRICRSGHSILSPADEYPRKASGKPTCRVCVIARSTVYRKSAQGLAGNLAAVEKYQATTKGMLARLRVEANAAYARKDSLETQE